MESQKQKHTIKGHLKAVGYAVVFGLSAYAVINLMMWVSAQFGGEF